MDSSPALLFSQTLSQVMWAISSAISVAFFALSGIAAQLLNALGLDGERRRTSQVSWSLACHFLWWGFIFSGPRLSPQLLDTCQVSPALSIRAG